MELVRDETLSQLQDRCGPLRYPLPLTTQKFPSTSQMRRKVTSLLFLFNIKI